MDGTGWWLTLIALGGCDLVLQLDPRDPPDAAAPAPDAPIPDGPPPELCAWSTTTQITFDPAIVPLHDFVENGAGLGMVSAFITQGPTQSRSGSIRSTGPTAWAHDSGPRDGVGGFSGVRIDPENENRIYALSQQSVTLFIARFTLGPFGWSEEAKHPIDGGERFGNLRRLGDRLYFTTTQHPVTNDPDTFLKLRVLDDGGAWNEEDRMAAINSKQIPDLGVMTRDGLTLIYSAADRATNANYDLFVSTRATTTDPFGVGAPITALNTLADEVEPWIAGACDRLYFRRGPSFFTGTASPSEIWLAN